MEQETIRQKQEKKQTVKAGVTRAAKAKRQKEILRSLLKNRAYKWNELLDEAVKAYVEKFGDEPIDIPDLKGKFGSNFSLLEEAGEAAFDKATNLCSLVEPSQSALQSASQNAAPQEEDTTTQAKTAPKKTKKNTADSAATRQTKATKRVAENKETDRISERISAEEEKRSAIETALKKAVEKAAAKKSEKPQIPEETQQTEKSQKTEEAERETAESAAKKEGAFKTSEKKDEKKDEKKTPAKRGRKSVKKADSVSAQESPAPVQNATEKVGTVQKEKEAERQEKTEQPEKKVAKNELLLTEFAFLGNSSKRAETKTAENISAAPVAAVAPSALVVPVTAAAAAANAAAAATEQKTDAVEKTVSGAAENVGDRGKYNAVEKKDEADMGAAKEENAAENSTARIQSASIDKNQAKNVRNTQSRSALNAQSAPSARSRLTRTSGTNAAGGRVNERYAVQTADEKLKEEFLRRLRSMSGEYFEYYAVYLLERYSLKNGRRLESLRITGGKNDGGIDGEIELTDRFGFRETIYIQAKNWDPTKGVAEKWMIGETLIQQFVGAATCRQSKDGKRNSRGIFMTTSSFTKEAKEILAVLGEKFIGYDGDDVYETAKECSFGLIRVNGVWQLDEKLLSGDKAFFNM
ncbi:MAG: restriction endonuclease [Candidatus Borkfalkiaceae bacterium]|nr:restriction endonuclease [Clostridia bacterium]MDY6223634.1 restriction endonuclease [Christensenellaceae bacterium]